MSRNPTLSYVLCSVPPLLNCNTKESMWDLLMKYLCPRDFRRGEMEEKMKIYKIFKKFMYVIDLFVVMICLYCWMINDFNSNLHDLGSKAIIVCVCVNLCCFIFEKKILSRSNK